MFSGRRRRKLVAEMSEELRAFAMTIARRDDLADDLVQEALARALSAARLPRDRRAFRAWMIKTMRNIHIDMMRKNAVRREYEEDAARFFGGTPPPEVSPLERMLVRQAFEQISPEHREVLCMVDVLGLRYAEAAEVLGIPQGTVMSRVSRARAKLLQEMDKAKVVTLPTKTKATRP